VEAARDIFERSTVAYLKARRKSRLRVFVRRFEARPLRGFIGLEYAPTRRSRVIIETTLVAFAILLVYGRRRCILLINMRQARIALAGNDL
jgi:hypothetical protein